ncbi:MAG: lysylphosphatidylglycerol synthase domain-containing protein [Solirubrobacteraceae bacterium]
MSDRPSFTIEYLEPVEIEAEPLPDEFSASRLKRSLLILGAVVVVVAAAIVLLPGLGSLRQRFDGAEPGWLLVAALLQLGSCASYVLAFRAVFCQRTSWRTSAEIGLAELAANSVFSIGGAGGLALGAWILRRGGLPASYIARRTVAFFLLTSLANVGFLALGGTLLTLGVLHGSPMLLLGLIPAVAGVLAIALAVGARPVANVLARRWMKERLVAAAEAVGDGVDEALGLLRTGNPAILLGAAGYMLFDVAMLGVCFTAFGHDVPPAGVLLVAYLIGQLGSLIPIPGGIGGVDGGLIGTLVLDGDDAGDAAVAVIAYRGLLLAIPAALGLPALAVLRKRLQSEAHDIAACAPGQSVEVLGRGAVERSVPVTTA